MSIAHSIDSQIEYDPDRQLAMLELFMQDVLDDASLADLIPSGAPGLDLYPRGSRPNAVPDFQTPRVDVYVIPRNLLNYPNNDPLDQ